MSYINDKFQCFLSCPDYEEIAKVSVNTAQMIHLLHHMINSYDIPCFPVFRDDHRSTGNLKVYNLKIQYPLHEDWDNIATVYPHKGFLEIFTFSDEKLQQSYFIKTDNRECIYKNKVVPLEQLFEEIKDVFKLRKGKEYLRVLFDS